MSKIITVYWQPIIWITNILHFTNLEILFEYNETISEIEW